MNITRYRNTLITAAVTASVGVGAAACSEAPDDSSIETRSNTTAAMKTTADDTQEGMANVQR
jgi:hypothetical protein